MRNNTSAELERREFYNCIILIILTAESPPVFTHKDL